MRGQHNGSVAGWTKNEVCFQEVSNPHSFIYWVFKACSALCWVSWQVFDSPKSLFNKTYDQTSIRLQYWVSGRGWAGGLTWPGEEGRFPRGEGPLNEQKSAWLFFPPWFWQGQMGQSHVLGPSGFLHSLASQEEDSLQMGLYFHILKAMTLNWSSKAKLVCVCSSFTRKASSRILNDP